MTTLDRIRASDPGQKKANLLEIGCGTGSFLKLATNVTPGRVVGLETALASADHCREKGLNVYCESIESYQHRTSDQGCLFDFVVAFHCLEHVPNPKGFVSAMKKMLNLGGRLYLSTPYSPMSFEAGWFDPLNHPPHHLTRWNYSAYRELASQLDLQMNFFMPNALGIADRMLNAMKLAYYGPNKQVSRKRMYLFAIMHAFVTLREYIHQAKRERIEDKVAADVILVELSRTESLHNTWAVAK